MAFKIFPTSIGGVQTPFNQLKGPLAKLLSNNENKNLFYPQDIGNNPAHCHVVQISIYDYTTELAGAVQTGVNAALNMNAQTVTSLGKTLQDVITTDGAISKDKFVGLATTENGQKALNIAQQVGSAKTYTPTKTTNIANISLYMPDTLNVQYSSGYNDVSLTQVLGGAGKISSAITEMGALQNMLNKAPADVMKAFAGTASAKALESGAISKIGGAVFGEGFSQTVGNAVGQITNPQLQLLFTGVDFRTFTMEFVFTPKSSAEAASTKQIIDTLVYYSSPGIAGQNTTGGASVNESTTTGQQQYLSTPQLFNIKFLFTGNQGLGGALSDIFNKALTNIGLDFLTNKQGDLASSKNINDKLFSIGDCVLMDVNVDYAPNGWASFSDGNPVATRVILTFKETNIVTKQRLEREGSKAVGISKK